MLWKVECIKTCENRQFDVGIALWALSISVFGPIAGETRVCAWGEHRAASPSSPNKVSGEQISQTLASGHEGIWDDLFRVNRVSPSQVLVHLGMSLFQL